MALKKIAFSRQFEVRSIKSTYSIGFAPLR